MLCNLGLWGRKGGTSVVVHHRQCQMSIQNQERDAQLGYRRTVVNDIKRASSTGSGIPARVSLMLLKGKPLLRYCWWRTTHTVEQVKPKSTIPCILASLEPS